MSNEAMDAQRTENIGARQEGHTAESIGTRYTLDLSYEEMYLALRALSKLSRAKHNRFRQLQLKYGAKADPVYDREAKRADRIIAQIHARTGGTLRFARTAGQ